MKNILLATLILNTGLLFSGEFNIKKLDKGSGVTLGRVAQTKIPIKERVLIQPTDSSQSIEIRGFYPLSKTTDIKVAIYNKVENKVRYVSLKHGEKFIYSFVRLKPIVVVAEKVNRKMRYHGAYIRVSSKKPLTYSR